jgi:tRNA (guanine-N7-)-methyltransferase
MVINNPYIEKVRQDTDILHIPEDIYSHKWKWNKYFNNSQDIVLEVGTGMWNFFSKQVWEHPDKNFIGMEIRYKRLFQTAEKSRKYDTSHFVMLKDFAQNIDKIFMENEVSETYIFFPDPWPKDRQKKHRLLQEEFLKNLYRVIKPGWKLFFKTDHREYFDSTKEVIEKQWIWKIVNWTHNYENSKIFDINNITEFEWMYRWENTDINYIELAS